MRRLIKAKQASIQWDDAKSAAENAKRTLPPLVEWHFARGREYLSQQTEPAALHALRLETKRIRYTLELFRDVYGPGLEEYLDALHQMQQHLGAINDHVVAGRFAARILPGGTPGRRQIDRYLTGRIEREVARLGRYWKRTFERRGFEQRWIRYLKNARNRVKNSE